MAKIPVGVQLYTLRDETAKDFKGTLEKVSQLGYRAVEFAGYGDIAAKDMKRLLDDLGLAAPSSHVPYEVLENNLEGQIEYSLEIGSQYIVLPWLNPEEKLKGDHFPGFIESLRGIGEKIRNSGLQLLYHNHDFEFAKVDGDYILDRLYASVPSDLLQAELDLFWVTKAGLDAKSYLSGYKGRCPIIHVKDMTKDDRRTFAEVGQGSIDYPEIFDITGEVGVKWYIVEQDVCERPPLESIKMSIEYLKSIGIA